MNKQRSIKGQRLPVLEMTPALFWPQAGLASRRKSLPWLLVVCLGLLTAAPAMAFDEAAADRG